MPAKRKPQLKTNAQVQRIFGLAKPAAQLMGVEVKEQIEETIFATIERNPRISELTFEEANLVIKQLGGDPFPKYGQSRRNQNYKKQQAGVKSIETDAQLKLIRELAAQRNVGEDGLTKLATRMRLPWPPNTTEQGNKLVEALKAMNARDRQNVVITGDFGSKPAAATQPSYRRVA